MVVRTFWCTCLISVRICTRSLASRLDSGSSNRNTFGLRTMARPMATRWRWPPESCRGLRSSSSVMSRMRRGLLDAARDLVLREALEPQPERHVLVHRHVRVERVVLEHHRHVAVLRRDVVDHLAVDRDLAAGDVLEAGDHPQRRRLAAAGRADQHHELLVGDVEIDAAHRLGVVEPLDHLAKRHLRHDALDLNPWWRRP